MGARLRLWWQKNKQLVIVVVVIGLAVVFALVVYIFGWDWTGFNVISSRVWTAKTPSGASIFKIEEQQLPKTLWDWMQLLIVPVSISFFGLWFTRKRQQHDQQLAEQRAQTEREIAEENLQEAALQAYLNRMSELLLEEKLLKSKPDFVVRRIAGARTLTTLRRLNSSRKGIVVEFLYESGLITNNKGESIIDLRNADLSQANLVGTDLSGASLRKVVLSGAFFLFGSNLSKADLREALLNKALLAGADLSSALLTDAALSGADLHEANLHEADLSRAWLNSADLRNANLSNANLSEAILWEANLSETELSGADLTSANLRDAIVTQEQLKQAKSLKGATMPDGTIIHLYQRLPHAFSS